MDVHIALPNRLDIVRDKEVTEVVIEICGPLASQLEKQIVEGVVGLGSRFQHAHIDTTPDSDITTVARSLSATDRTELSTLADTLHTFIAATTALALDGRGPPPQCTPWQGSLVTYHRTTHCCGNKPPHHVCFTRGASIVAFSAAECSLHNITQRAVTRSPCHLSLMWPAPWYRQRSI
jgi:hypothetical protein